MLPTGIENKDATAVENVDVRDPLDITFVDCSPILPGGDEPVMNKDAAAVEGSPHTRGKSKRKAKASPEVVTPSDDERSYKTPRSSVSLRKPRPRKKKPNKTGVKATAVEEECSSLLMSTESERDTDTESHEPGEISSGTKKRRNP